MNTLDAIFTRRSTRQFTRQPISREDLHTILEAAMSGPCCVHARDWFFLAVTDRETLDKMAEANGRAANPLKQAPAGILVCGDLSRAFPSAKDYWIIDGPLPPRTSASAPTTWASAPCGWAPGPRRSGWPISGSCSGCRTR